MVKITPLTQGQGIKALLLIKSAISPSDRSIVYMHALTRHVCQNTQTPWGQECSPHMPASPIWKDKKDVTDDGTAGA